MDDNVKEILEGLPPKPPRSRLEPHATLIEEMRRRGWTYREIARVLAEKCQIRSVPSNIYYFLRLRARKARQTRLKQGKLVASKPAVSQLFESGKIDSNQGEVENVAPTKGLQPVLAQRLRQLRTGSCRNRIQQDLNTIPTNHFAS